MNITWEENVLRALGSGDQKAFELLFLRYQPKLIYFLNGFIKNKDLAKDLAQDIFFNIWENRKKISQVHSFQAYIFKMGKNAICNYYDHSLVKIKFEQNQLTFPLKSENFEEDIFTKELQERINNEVENMPSQRKLVFKMSRIEGMSNTEIAEKLNLNKRTVENHVTTALADLRKVIKTFISLVQL